MLTGVVGQQNQNDAGCKRQRNPDAGSHGAICQQVDENHRPTIATVVMRFRTSTIENDDRRIHPCHPVFSHFHPARSVWETVSIVGLATTWWPYTKLDFSEPLVLTVAFLEGAIHHEHQRIKRRFTPNPGCLLNEVGKCQGRQCHQRVPDTVLGIDRA